MYVRGDKEEDIDTIRYEIDMLDFSYRRIPQMDNAPDRGDWNAFLECFLLHYRNLIEFFAGKAARRGKGPRDTDLSIIKPDDWAPSSFDRSLIPKLTCDDLYNTYFQKISQYLQHCTKVRAEEPQSWKTAAMYVQINPTLVAFEKEVGLKRLEPGGVVTERRDHVDGASTASVSWTGGIDLS